jgi:hypothetical protein
MTPHNSYRQILLTHILSFCREQTSGPRCFASLNFFLFPVCRKIINNTTKACVALNINSFSAINVLGIEHKNKLTTYQVFTILWFTMLHNYTFKISISGTNENTHFKLLTKYKAQFQGLTFIKFLNSYTLKGLALPISF